jgi:hypothetical protein
MTSGFAAGPYGLSGGLGPGRRIAGYLIDEQTGAGGIGEVFRPRRDTRQPFHGEGCRSPQASWGRSFRRSSAVPIKASGRLAW